MAISKVVNQFFHQAEQPLDSSSVVATAADLTDTTKVGPYVGKTVFVRDEGVTYICHDVTNRVSSWRKLFNANASCFYLYSADGHSLAVTVENTDSGYRLAVNEADN